MTACLDMIIQCVGCVRYSKFPNVRRNAGKPQSHRGTNKVQPFLGLSYVVLLGSLSPRTESILPENSFDPAQFSRLNSRVENLVADKLISHPSQSLVYLFLSHRFYREQFEIEESHTDGGNDCGVDAVYIDRRTEQPVVHLFQSKYFESERKARNAFKSSDAEKIIRFLEVLCDRDADLSKVANARLEQKILEIRDLQDRDFPDFKLWLVSNGQPCVPHELSPIRNALAKHDVSVEEFHLREYVEFCVDAHSTRTSHTFHARDAGVLEFGTSELRSFVGYISARQLYDLLKDIRDERKADYSLFDMNVRGFLGLDNPVNKEIFHTAASSDNRHFASLNNGITIVGTQCKIMRTGTDTPKVGVKRMSIVNGAQTCSAIFDAMKDFYPDFERFDRLSVLFRIFETDDPELIARIAVSTNNQNRINPRDLRANDDAQRRLERELKEHGIVYLRKRGQFATGTHEGRKLDALRAGQLILSYTHHDPARAKRDSDSIFTESYQKIFASASTDELVEALDWFDLIEEKKRFIQDEIRIRGAARTENTFVTYGAFHILMLCSLLGKNATGDHRVKIIEEAIGIICDQLREAGEPAYYSFFRDPKQTERLRSGANQPTLL